MQASLPGLGGHGQSSPSTAGMSVPPGLQAGRHISENDASPEKHRVPCADLLVPLWSFMHSVWS